ncbi:MAG: LysM peptidoglycan-binding domain-containing protein [Mariprofundaceae bacterium]|nr:LysM peptidoglycan-binding domain-containing protein [Mariprofundaceae bacterium]
MIVDRIQPVAVLLIVVSLLFPSAFVFAEEPRKDVLDVSGETKPYVVKKGDTLWDIATLFFKEPKKWVLIWEKNNQITNPHLIYPGDQVWLNGKGEISINVKPKDVSSPQQVLKTGLQEYESADSALDADAYQAGGYVEWEPAALVPSPYDDITPALPHLKIVRMKPEIQTKAVQRLEKPRASDKFLTALKHQDFVETGELQGVGHIVNSSDQRLYYSLGDIMYISLSMDTKVYPGDLFNVFRRDKSIVHPGSGDDLGSIIEHLGQLKVISKSGDLYRASVVKTFTEFTNGDRLRPADDMNDHVTLNYPTEKIRGHIVYMRNAIAEVGKDHIVAIDLGIRHGVSVGSVLSVHRLGRLVQDPLDGEDRTLPDEKIGEMIVLAVQDEASMAIITQSSDSISFQDVIRSEAR